jgi:hypothetical protein
MLLAGHTTELTLSVDTGGSMIFRHCEQTLQLDGQHSAQQKLAPSSNPSAQERCELHEPQRTSQTYIVLYRDIRCIFTTIRFAGVVTGSQGASWAYRAQRGQAPL